MNMLQELLLIPDAHRESLRLKLWVDRGEVEWLIDVHRMLLNHRVMMDPTDDPHAWGTYGWCYRNAVAAVAAVAVWDPTTQDEPEGWHKRAGRIRRAPERAADAPVRCEHGRYNDCPIIGCEYWVRECAR